METTVRVERATLREPKCYNFTLCTWNEFSVNRENGRRELKEENEKSKLWWDDNLIIRWSKEKRKKNTENSLAVKIMKRLFCI